MQTRKTRYFALIGILGLLVMPNVVYAEEILITLSSDMNQVIFDGRWTEWTEWKRSSLDTLKFEDDSIFHLRTAHQDEFVYIMINFVTDKNHNRFGDKAVVCFDTKNNKAAVPDNDDYCFVSVMDRMEGMMFQGGAKTFQDGGIRKIPNDENFIAVGAMSDENDRYSDIPHASYEFRIPTSVIDRSSTYGFYVSVFDAHKGHWYSWPENKMTDNSFFIPSPATWGEIVSPDKSLPEFSFAYMVFAVSIMIPLLSRLKFSI